MLEKAYDVSVLSNTQALIDGQNIAEEMPRSSKFSTSSTD